MFINPLPWLAIDLDQHDPVQLQSKTVLVGFTRELQFKNWSLAASDDALILRNQQVLYSATLQLGSQGTEVTVQLDTGSSDLWVDNNAFDTSASNSWTPLNEPFSIGYGDGSTAQGEFGQDTVVIGEVTVTQAQFAVATQDTTGGTFVFGVGLTSGESSAEYDSRRGTYTNTYANLPQVLKTQGVTESASYSLWLDDWEAATGSILFGGVDHTKYVGTLAKLPVITTVEQAASGTISPNVPDRLTVTLNSVSISNSKGKTANVVTGANIPVLLDSGTTMSYLPNAWVKAIAGTLGAKYNSQYAAWIVSEDLSGSINYNFAGVEISVPFESFLRTLTLTDGTPATDGNGNNLLALGLLNGNPQGSTDGVHIDDGTIYILGDTFLCGAYVAFDLDNLEIGLAPAVSGVVSSSSIDHIGASGIPSATQAPSYSSTKTHSSFKATTATNLF